MTAKQFATEPEEKENRLGEILATILVKNFPQYLDPSDFNEMREKLEKLNKTNDSFQKESLQNELNDLATSYSILLNIFLFKIIANNTNNPQDAGRANCAFDEMMQSLKTGDINNIRRIQHENEDLLKKNVTGLGNAFSAGIG